MITLLSFVDFIVFKKEGNLKIFDELFFRMIGILIQFFSDCTF